MYLMSWGATGTQQTSMPTLVADQTNNKSMHVPMHLTSDAFYLKEATTPFEISQTKMIRLSKISSLGSK